MSSWRKRVKGTPQQIGRPYKLKGTIKTMPFTTEKLEQWTEWQGHKPFGKSGRRSYGEIAEDLTHDIDVFYRDEQKDSIYMKDLLFDFRYKKVQRMLKIREKLLQHGWDIGTNASWALKELKRRYEKPNLGKINITKGNDTVKVYLRTRLDYDKVYRLINDVLEDEYHKGIIADEIVAIEMDKKLWSKINKRIEYEER